MKNLQSHPTHSDVPNRFLAAFLAAILFSLLLQNAVAATKTWRGSTSGNWNLNANWSGGVPADGDDLVFPANAIRFTTINDIAGLNLRSITFSGSNYVLRGNSITLTNGISATYSSGTSTIDFAIQLDAAQTFNCVNAAATLLVSGNININGHFFLTVTGSGDTTLAGLISGTGFLTKTGAGTLLLAGSVNNTYSGTTTVSGGILQLKDSAGLSATMVPGDVSISNGTLLLEEGNQIADTSDVTVGSAGLFNLAGFGETIASLTLTAGGAVTTGPGTLTLGGNVTVNSSANIASISGNLNLGGATRTFTLANGTASPDLAISAIINNGGIIKTGLGSLQLSGANTYSGQTTVNAGLIEVANATALGMATSGTTLNGGNLLVQGVSVLNEPLTNNSSASEFQSTNTAGWSGNIVLNSPLGVVVFGAGGTFNLSGIISGSGALAKGEVGMLIYSGAKANTYTNTTTVNQGTLVLSKSALNGTIRGPLVIGDGIGGVNADVVRLAAANQTVNTPVTVTSSGWYDMNSFNDAIGSLAGNGNVVLGTATLILGLDDTSTTFSGIISGAGGVNKFSGTRGTQTFSGPNTYTGRTTVDGGRLLVNGSQPQSHVSLGAGGRLGGSGTVGNITNILGGVVAPGASPGILTCSNATFSGASSDFTVELNGSTPGTGYDQLNVRGTASLSGSKLNVSVGGGFVPTEGQSFTILTNDLIEGITGTFAGLPEGAILSAGAFVFTISYVGGSGKDVTLTFVGTRPSITTQPQSQTVNVGTNVTFTVVATGTEPLSYQWRFNTTNIAGATATNYTLTNVLSTDAGDYSVIVTNVAGSATSAKATLTVVVPGLHIWSGAAADNFWTTTANWSVGGAPFTNEAPPVVLIFPGGITGAALTSVDNIAGLQVDQIQINGSDYSFSASAGVTLTLKGTMNSLTAAGAGANTCAIPLVLTGANPISIASSGTLALNAVISGSGGLVSTNTGTLILSGTNTYTGETDLLGGTLLVNGRQPQSDIVLGVANLGGTGTVGRISMSGSLGARIVSPGISPGILSCSNVTFNAETTFAVELNGTTPGSGYDELNVAGSVDLGASFLTVTAGFTPAVGNTFTILNNDGADAVSGTFAGLAQGALLTNGVSLFQISYTGGDGNDVTLTFVGSITTSDNFSDGNDTSNPAWTHLDGYVGSTGQSWDASTGVYRLTAPNNGVSALGFIGSHVGAAYTDVRVSADIVSFVGPPAGAVFGVAARLNGNNAVGGLSGYAYAYEPFAASGTGEMVLYRINPGISVSDIGSQRVTLDPNKDYTFVLEIIGPNLHGQVFEIGGGMVAERFATDATYASGFSGLVAYSQNPVPPVDLSVDNFMASVPVPQPFSLGAPARLPNSTIQFSLNGQVGRSYTIEYSSNLANWLQLTNFTSTNASMTVLDPTVGPAQRFYRGVTP